MPSPICKKRGNSIPGAGVFFCCLRVRFGRGDCPELGCARGGSSLPHRCPSLPCLSQQSARSGMRPNLSPLVGQAGTAVGRWHQSCPFSKAKPGSCTRIWAGRHRSTGTGRYCLAALLTFILRSFITSDRWQEMRVPLQMLIIL